MRRAGAVTLTLTVLLLAVPGCSSRQERYCDAVTGHQDELTRTLGTGKPDALLTALPVLRDLRDKAPADLGDEWGLLTDRIGALAHALDTAGVDPAAYDGKHPPADVTPAQRTAIERAARDLGAQDAQQAWRDVQQQARDVCGTPLFLG
jgi:hypothetical protein